MQIYIDGGIRRGMDIFKAIALGATAVGKLFSKILLLYIKVLVDLCFMDLEHTVRRELKRHYNC